VEIIMFTGPQTFGGPAVHAAIENYFINSGLSPYDATIVVADARGVDAAVRTIAEKFGFFVFRLERKGAWRYFPNYSAGPRGNALMAQVATRGVAVVPQEWVRGSTPGTTSAINELEKLGKPVEMIYV
jgi:hypothetical protein